MVKPRNTASSSLGTGSVAASSATTPGGKRKRVEYEDATGQSGSKKTYYMTAGKKRDRSQTPGTKNAHFAKPIVTGATPAEHISGRGGSPFPSNMRKASGSKDGPGAQLQADLSAATLDHDNVPSLPPANRRSSASRKRLSDAPDGGASTGLSNALADARISSPKQKKPVSPKRRARDIEDGLELDSDMEVFGPTLEATAAIARSSLSGHTPDDDVCGKVNEIREKAMAFAISCPSFPERLKHQHYKELLVPNNEHLIRHIGCLAMGGRQRETQSAIAPKGEINWIDLLANTKCRSALVCGIIGRVLKEHVFSDLYFGASPELSETLKEQEEKLVSQDGKFLHAFRHSPKQASDPIQGFFRTRQRAMAITNHKVKAGDTMHFRKAVARVAVQLEVMLYPLWIQSTSGTDRWKTERKTETLAEIVALAANLSRELRTTPDVVYYWPPTFKDEEFEPSRMECFNLKDMITNSPYDKKEVNGFERAVLRAGEEHRSEAVVQIVCFPGLVAYRKGGGELAAQELAEERNENLKRDRRENLPPDVKRHRQALSSQDKSLDPTNGFRTRVIGKSVIWLQWSKQRLLTKEAGTSRHIDAIKNNTRSRYDDDDAKFSNELYELYSAKLKKPEPPQQSIIARWWSPSAAAEPVAQQGTGGGSSISGRRAPSRGRK